MIKADIVKQIANGLSHESHECRDKEAHQIVDALIDSVRETILKHERLEIRDFGVFEIKERKARMGRNPKNRKPYPIPSHKVVTFKPGKEIRNLPASLQGEGPEDDVE